MFYTFLRRIVMPFFRLIYRPKIKGLENLPEGSKYIIISNHLGKVDCFAIVSLFKEKIFFMAKKEWFDNKFKNKFFRWLGGIPVDRESADVTSIKNCFAVLKKGSRLVVFPEGTRNRANDCTLLPIKGGAGLIAFKAKVQVVPLVMKNRFRPFRKNYMYIGKPFDFSQYEGLKLSSELNEQLTNKMSDSLKECMDNVIEFSKENKRK
ncbi:MAG: 1-acyl-sn-glycerol-3-phosphate acyltransferase [Clostridiales bacterium]|nr:1-acyl-sn-glycerol-3-phosphate acyltransferase [Clostridiales bacterium]